MPIEVEQKYRLTDRDALFARLAALGAVAMQTVTQVDTYYAHPARDFATTDEALRIRRVGDASFITYKGPKLDQQTKTRREIELPLLEVADPGFAELLQALSFHSVAEVTKVRQIFSLERAGQTIEISVDQVNGVGGFVELEIVVSAEAQIPPAQQQIAALASELQLEHSERRSYLELLLQK